MPQVFHPSMNILSRVSIFGAVFLIAFLLWLAAAVMRSPYVTEAGVVRSQPVPFSHKHHVQDDGIDCRYCHTTVETAAFAGIPSTNICMNCHSHLWAEAPMLAPVRESFRTGRPLEWTRVHDLPDFAYFDHSIHVRKGIGCVTCHGRVDEMPLMWREHTLHMEWCLDCHRNPERYVRPREYVFDMDPQPLRDREQLIVKLRDLSPDDPHAGLEGMSTDALRMLLGKRLVAEYRIEVSYPEVPHGIDPKRPWRRMTNCSICHR